MAWQLIATPEAFAQCVPGETWTPRESNRNWAAVASSADGSKLVAVVINGGQIYTSACAAIPSTSPCVPAPANMVLWLPFDETSGASSVNLVPGGNNGTRINGPVVNSGFVDHSLSFNGVNQYVDVPSYNAINFGTNDFSINAWVRRAANDTGTSAHNIVDKRDISASGYAGFAFYLMGSEGTVGFDLADGGPYTRYSSSLAVPNDQQWHHVAVTVGRANTNGLVFYLDGVADSVPRNPTLRPGSVSTASLLRVGSQSSSVDYLFSGSIDEVGLFNRVLAPAEIAALFNAGSAGQCKTTPTGYGDNNLDTDFWLTFPANYAPDPVNPPQLRLYLTGPTGVSGSVTIPGLAFTTNWTITASTIGTVSNFGVATINLPWQADLGELNDAVTNKGIHVTATNGEIAVYALNHAPFTSDTYLGLPTDVLGTEYIILGYPNGQKEVPELNGTQFAMVAISNKTSVTITPRIATGGHLANLPFTIVMNRGDTYQLRNTNNAPNDLSGTVITANYPIGVFGSHQCANVPSANPAQFFCDYLVEQLLPITDWGMNFVAMPLATRLNGDTYRIVAAQDKTTVRLNGTPIPRLLNRGEVYEQIVQGSAHITSDQPVLVAQYANSSDYDAVTDSDPFMVLIPPTQLFDTQYFVFSMFSMTNGFTTNFLNVVAPAAMTNGIIALDGIPISSFSPIPLGDPASGCYGAQIGVMPGLHILLPKRGSLDGFGVTVYGFAEYDAYGYPAGLHSLSVNTTGRLTLYVVTVTALDTKFSQNVTNSTKVGVRFSELLEPASATLPANYTIAGATITAAALQPDGMSVALTVSGLSSSSFTVLVSGVKDLTGNVIAAGTQVAGTKSTMTAQDIQNLGGNDPIDPGSVFSAKDGDFDVIAGGSGYGKNSDGFFFISSQVTGDFDVKVRLARLDAANNLSQAGIMARESLSPDSRYINAIVDPDPATGSSANVWEANYRGVTGATAAGQPGWTPAGPLPYPNVWVRLQRVGNDYTSYRSIDGVGWSKLTTFTPSPAYSTTYLGLATTSHDNSGGKTTTCYYRAYGVFTPVLAASKLTINPAGSSATISWAPTGGTLQTTSSLVGTPAWANVGTANPATITLGTSSAFYRVKSP